MGLRDLLRGLKKELPGRGKADKGAQPAVGAPSSIPQFIPQEPDADGYRAVCAEGQLRDGVGRTVRLGARNVALFRVEGGLYAVDDACRHEDGPVGEGKVVGCVVTCPYHDWKYDVRTGDCLTDPTRPLASYAVRAARGFIWVGPRRREGSEARGGEHDDGLKTVRVD